MTRDDDSELLLVTAPGLEPVLLEEARALGLAVAGTVPGGVTVRGGWFQVVQANLWLRTAVRVLWRIGSFRALHLAQLDKRARKLDWAAWLAPATPVKVEATCRKSRIYHDRAAAQRVARAITDAIGAPASESAPVLVKVRIEDDLCTVSIDTTGESLHRRGHKAFVGKAPLRETLAAGFLHMMGFDGTQTVVDPMCGSGTIPLEAADIAAGQAPGRSRRFAFQDLVGAPSCIPQPQDPRSAVGPLVYGYDRDDGAIKGAIGNAARAGLSDWCRFARQPISDLAPPEGAPGIVLVNPPYGARIGNRKLLFGLYGTLGQVLAERFAGWRIGIVTSDAGLARATGLNLTPLGPVAHGGLRVTLWRCGPG